MFIIEVVGWPPCIRIIITESKACKSLVGKLFLITCPGGTIGRSTNRDVVVPDDNVSKVNKYGCIKTLKLSFDFIVSKMTNN